MHQIVHAVMRPEREYLYVQKVEDKLYRKKLRQRIRDEIEAKMQFIREMEA